MKYIKKYENIKSNDELKVGDYVQINTNRIFRGFNNPDFIKEIVNSTIGQISSIERKDIIVKYEINNNIYLRFTPNDVIESGETKEEVESKLTAKKYNL